MTKDAVVLASMEKITLVGVYILILVVAGVWGWDGVDLNDRGGRMHEITTSGGKISKS
ncbi:MAG TPA: hypothetical protein VK776_03080 [Bryobacteraceae bacterium]|nr:hypothetical protein [Bryobacteraceae bacterium]